VKKVVILLSDKRSGSTMLQEALCGHADISHVEYSPHTYFETHHWLKGAVLLGMAPKLFSSERIYPGYGSKSNARAYLIDCVTKNVPDFVVPDDDRKLVFEGWDALCNRVSTGVFFEKSPQCIAHWASLSLLLEWINATEMDVKIIGLTRNPLSVQYSAQKLFHTNPNSRQYGWLELHKNLLAFKSMLPSSSYLQLKYEDIIENPAEQLAKICRFVGVPLDDNLAHSVHDRSVAKWKADPEFHVSLDETVKQMARHLGYSDAEFDNSTKSSVTQSRKISRYLTGRAKLMLARLKDRLFRPLILRWRQSKR
jgi:sulfotransferase family protein